ncbi:MAG TPA: hypothetical protein PKD70_06275 [Saprospiraceae bacterium]|nr:hypothetical protein [Saprospiraceae bacterium]
MVTSQRAKQFIFYLNAYANQVNVSGGNIRFCHCGEKNALRCFYAAQGGYAYVQNIFLKNGTALNSVSGFSFPYTLSQLATLQSDLEAYLFNFDPCPAYLVTVQLSGDIQIIIDQTCLRFESVTFSDTPSGGGVAVAFSENCNQGTAPEFQDVSACALTTCNPFSPPPVGPSLTLSLSGYVIGTGITPADITVTFNGDAAPFTYDPITGLVTAFSPYLVSSSCFGINPVFNYTWFMSVTTVYGTDTFICNGVT